MVHGLCAGLQPADQGDAHILQQCDKEGPTMTRKIVAWTTTIALLTNLFGFVAFADTDDTPLSLGNDVITFSVDADGTYQIRTTEEGNPSRPDDGNKTLLFFK